LFSAGILHHIRKTLLGRNRNSTGLMSLGLDYPPTLEKEEAVEKEEEEEEEED